MSVNMLIFFFFFFLGGGKNQANVNTMQNYQNNETEKNEEKAKWNTFYLQSTFSLACARSCPARLTAKQV